jgi:phage pi2 protein 07
VTKYTSVYSFSENDTDDDNILYDYGVVNIDEESATITWKTNNPADSRIYYVENSASSLNQVKYIKNSAYTINHGIEIKNLQSNTRYNIWLGGQDANGNIYGREAVSLDNYTFGFKTLSDDGENYDDGDDTDDEDNNTGEEENNNDNGNYDMTLSKRVAGKFLLAVEDKGRIYYVDTKKFQKYEVTFGNVMELFEKLALGINQVDLYKIAIDPRAVSEKNDHDGDGYNDKSEVENGYNPDVPSDPQNRGNDKVVLDKKVSDRLKGKLLLAVEDYGRIWYVNEDGKRWEVTFANALNLFKELSLGITNSDLDKIEEVVLELKF